MKRYQDKTRASFRIKEVPQFELSDKTLELISIGWNSLLEKNNSLFNSRLLRTLEIIKEKDELIFNVSPDIDYKKVVGLRFHKNFLEKIPRSDTFQVLSVGAHIETADQKFIFLERNSGDWENSLELPGGFVRADEKNTDLDNFIRQRIASDLDIEIKHIDQISIEGILDFKEICEMMLIYKVELILTFEELINSTKKKIFQMPSDYSLNNHDRFFKIPLHYPSGVVLKSLF